VATSNPVRPEDDLTEDQKEILGQRVKNIEELAKKDLLICGIMV
jgi:hypothetical protein